jgi:large subunit ribosomal protein L7/L12
MSDEVKNIEVPEKFKGIVDQLKALSVIDMSELVKVCEEVFGVSAAAAVAAAPAAGGAAAEEKSTFNVELTEAGANKIGVIKVIREVTGLGLKEAKDMVDAAPKVVKEGAAKAEAEETKKKIEEAGGKATLK